MLDDDEVDQVAQRFKKRAANVGIIGLGYVGLPLTLATCRAGFSVLGFDIDHAKVQGLNSGRSPLAHIGDANIDRVLEQGLFRATADFSRLADVDAILICVPTPLGPHREPDLRFIVDTVRTIAANRGHKQLIVLESTTFPETTRKVVKPILEAAGAKSEIDFFLCYSPEREDPGNPNFSTSQIPKVVSGDGRIALDLCMALYEQIFERIVPVTSLETAEAIKLTENIFRAVNIALVNELKIVFSALEIDTFEVIDAAKTKPFGFMPFYPGPGLGGHCIPIDPFYLTWKARELGISTRFIELAGEINTSMPAFVVGRLRVELDRRFGKGLSGSRILIVGMAYKKNIDDMRESPALAIFHQLENAGARVSYYDPYCPVIPLTREHADLAGKQSVLFDEQVLSEQEAAVIVTDHDNIDYRTLARCSRLVIDTRNALARVDERFDSVAKA
jgi:UDP-N-acetyl-D-glucosamine dehydrogenase